MRISDWSSDVCSSDLRAYGRQAGLDAWITEDAFLRFARLPVVVDFFVGTARDAHPPAAALLLVEKHDAVLLALVDRAGWRSEERRVGKECVSTWSSRW